MLKKKPIKEVVESPPLEAESESMDLDDYWMQPDLLNPGDHVELRTACVSISSILRRPNDLIVLG